MTRPQAAAIALVLGFARFAHAEASQPSGMIGLRFGIVGPDITVLEVVPGSPAADARIAVGDRLQAVDGQPVGPWTLKQAAERLRGETGSPVTATFQRGEAIPVVYHLIRRAPAPPPAPPALVGLRFDVAGPDVVVQAVVPDSPAAQAGISAGDKLLTVDGQPVGPWTLKKIVDHFHGPAGTPVVAEFQRGDAAPVEYRLIRRALAVPANELPAPPEEAAEAGPTPASPDAPRVKITPEEAAEELLP